MAKHKHNKKAWVVSVNMGYGHLRASYPLKDMAYNGQIIIANVYPGIPPSDRKLWQQSRKSYEFISRFKGFPLIGEKVWKLYDKMQTIPKHFHLHLIVAKD